MRSRHSRLANCHSTPKCTDQFTLGLQRCRERLPRQVRRGRQRFLSQAAVRRHCHLGRDADQPGADGDAHGRDVGAHGLDEDQTRQDLDGTRLNSDTVRRRVDQTRRDGDGCRPNVDSVLRAL